MQSREDNQGPAKGKLSAVLVCVILGIMVVMIALFLIMRPLPLGAGGANQKQPTRTVSH